VSRPVTQQLAQITRDPSGRLPVADPVQPAGASDRARRTGGSCVR